MAEKSDGKEAVIIWDELPWTVNPAKVKKSSKDFECPICHIAMKVNVDFMVARCPSCHYELNWSNPEALAYSILRLAEEIAVRKYRWRKQDLPSQRCLLL